MAFGPIMKFTVNDLHIELAPLSRESMAEFVNIEHGGGMQRHEVTRYLGKRLSPVLEDEYEWFDKIRASKDDIKWGIWLIEGDKRTVIGESSLNNVTNGNAAFIKQATSGSVIFRPEYWGKGIATATYKARAWYAFQQLGVHCIKSAALKGNRGSSKALSRSGYQYIYTERNSHFVDGKLHHLRHFECVNSYDLFWDQWWHGEEPTSEALEARQLTREAMSWAERNVTLA